MGNHIETAICDPGAVRLEEAIRALDRLQLSEIRAYWCSFYQNATSFAITLSELQLIYGHARGLLAANIGTEDVSTLCADLFSVYSKDLLDSDRSHQTTISPRRHRHKSSDFRPSPSKHHIDYIDALELFSSIIMIADAPIREKISFLFDAWDMSEDKALDLDEFTISFKSTLYGISKILKCDTLSPKSVRTTSQHNLKINQSRYDPHFKYCLDTLQEDDVCDLAELIFGDIVSNKARKQADVTPTLELSTLTISCMDFQTFCEETPMIRSIFIFFNRTDTESSVQEFANVDQYAPSRVSIKPYNSSEYHEGSQDAIENLLNYVPVNDLDHDGFSHGDEFLASKPWKGSIFAPTKPIKPNVSPPDEAFHLDHVFGFNATIRNSLRYVTACPNEIVFAAAAVCVIMNTVNKSQRHFVAHTDDILSLCIHRTQCIAASGEVGKQPKIFIWDLESMQPICTLQGLHQRGVLQLAFYNSPIKLTSIKGKSDGLISIGADDDHTIGIYESSDQWRNAQLCFFIKGNKAAPFNISVSFTNSREWVSCGDKYIEFWTIENTQLKPKWVCRKAIFKNRGFLQGFIVSQYLSENSIAIGTSDGNLYHFKNRELVQSVSATDARSLKGKSGAVNALYMTAATANQSMQRRLLVSGTSCGCILVWDDQLRHIAGPFKVQHSLTYDTSIVQTCPSYTSVRSAAFSSDNAKILIGTSASEIYELDAQNGQNVHSGAILQSHFLGEVWGLAKNPTNEMQCCTAGDDHTIRIWDLEKRTMLRHVRIDAPIRSCAYSNDGRLIAIGTSSLKTNAAGNTNAKRNSTSAKSSSSAIQFIVFNECDLSVHCAPSNRYITRSVTDLKFSPDDRFLMIASSDKGLYFYSTTQDYMKVGVFRKHTSGILHADFSSDGNHVASLSSGYELLFCSSPSCQHVSNASQFRDESWNTMTCPLGFWSVQGIWPPFSDGSDINAADRSSDLALIATGDDNGMVKIFRYPCSTERSPYVQLCGHSSHVTNVRWSASSRMLLSVGGRDRCFFVWKRDSSADDVTSNVKRYDTRTHKDKARIDHDMQMKSSEFSFDGTHTIASFTRDCDTDPGIGDEFLAVKPWIGAIVPPSSYVKSSTATAAPSIELELTHVHGYQAQQSQNNARYDSGGRIVYHAAALGIVYDPTTQKQMFMKSHTDDIIALCSHQNGSLFATSQMGKKPSIYIWSSKLESTIPMCLEGFHKRGVNAICFSSTEAKIGSVGLDDDNSVAIYNYATGQLIASARGERSLVLSIAYDSIAKEWITCGEKHIRFWKEQGRNLTSKRAILRLKESKPRQHASRFACIVLFKQWVLVGGSDGCMYQFVCGSSQVKSIISAHSADIYAMYSTDESVLSGAKDATIVRWDVNLHVTHKIDLRSIGSLANASNIHSIRSLCLQSLSKSNNSRRMRILVGTGGSQLFELDVEGTHAQLAHMVTQGHYQSEVWGLATHPNKLEYITAGEDRTLRVWVARYISASSSKSEQVRSLRLKASARACTIASIATSSSSMDLIAVGFGGQQTNPASSLSKSEISRDNVASDCIGSFLILNYQNLDERLCSDNPSKQSISDLKFSPNNQILAVGSHDRAIYLYKISITQGKFNLIKTGKFAKHHSYITHFDFSANSQYLQSNCGAYELLYADARSGKQITSAHAIRDTIWDTWTCTLGWPVQGIWPLYADGTDINAVDRDMTKSCLATGDDFGLVKLFAYPCISKNSSCLSYRGHSSHVTNVRWSKGGEYVISVGGHDRTVMEWKVTRPSNEKEHQSKRHSSQRARSPPVRKSSHSTQLDIEQTATKDSDDDDTLWAQSSDKNGDEFMAIKPWTGAIVPPDNHPIANSRAPKIGIKLDWVYGYQCELSRQNVFYNPTLMLTKKDEDEGSLGEIVYHTAAAGIIYDPSLHFQKHHLGHDDDIICLTLSETLDASHHGLAATGERGKTPAIRIWDAHTGKLYSQVKAIKNSRGILSLAFNTQLSLLLSVTNDDDNSVTLWADKSHGSWSIVAPVASGRGEKLVHRFAFFLHTENALGNPLISFVTGGLKHVLIWSMEGKRLVYRRGSVGKKGLLQNFPCGCAIRRQEGSQNVSKLGIFATGTARGEVYIWAANEVDKCIKAHEGPVDAISSFNTCVNNANIAFVSGGRDGKILLWDTKYQVIKKLDLTVLDTSIIRPEVRSLCLHHTATRLLVGIASSDIIQLDIHPAASGSRADKQKILVSGHFLQEVWGLAVHPKYYICATVGDDATLRLWNIEKRRMLRLYKLPHKSRACAFSPNGKLLAIGFGSDLKSVVKKPNAQASSLQQKDGLVMIVYIGDSHDPEHLSLSLASPVLQDRSSKEWISDLKFSPSNHVLACGSHDNNIYLYKEFSSGSSITFRRYAIFQKHRSYVTHLDFSRDSKYLQSNCGGYEYLFCDVETGKQITSARALKNTDWSTWTCTLGWPVQGIWPEFADGTDINAVSASSSRLLIAIGNDSSKVKVFRYPCTLKGAKCIELCGHSSHVTNVRFCMDDRYLVSTGGNDRSVFQWQLQ